MGCPSTLVEEGPSLDDARRGYSRRHAVHRGSPAGDLDRLTLIAEFHSAAKCPVLDVLGLGLPCPSGDQWLVV